ncbi:3-hydroxyacyl-CoA dehydrogenase NAD-binding domain-containing protein [Candidatus Poriferisocius sp.]|uniref:3-hydroxyacyl-CoA dehydrogenase NAD-binding domain-containing protein n=1 Tax=Candidatus Poriferisocius sp. TaxID=3101276 RepID=UPI003B5221D1
MSLAMTTKTIGVVGTGVIGSGWAVRVLARGCDVVAWDPADGAEDRLREAIERAWPSATERDARIRAASEAADQTD